MTNVFNTLNVREVYRATGNAGDDGYLNASEFQNSLLGKIVKQLLDTYIH